MGGIALLRLCYLLPFLALISWQNVYANPLTMGTISNAPVKEIRQFTPVIEYVVKQLDLPEIQSGEMVMATNIQQMAELLKAGKVDFYYDSPLPSMAVNHLAGSEMVLRRWKHDVPEYTALIFVKQDSKIKDLSDLVGQTVGFKDEFSSSGYLLPRIALSEASLDLTLLPGFSAKVESGKTGYLFTKGNENTIIWVLFGRIAAGAISREDFNSKAKADVDQLRILHETLPIPRQVVNFRRDLPKKVQTALMRVLIGMDQNQAGREMLLKFEKTSKFDSIPPETLPRLEKIRPTVLKILGIN